jgi:hypothetical protein
MVIGITINNILRDHISQLEKVCFNYIGKEPIGNINPYNLYKAYPKVESTIEVEEFDDKKEVVLTPMDSPMEEFDVYNFIYNEAAFEIFGRSDELIPNIIRKISTWESKLKCKILLMNKESPRSKCATLFFLSKNGFDLNTIYFPKSNADCWRSVDVLITDDPKLLKYKPKGKHSIRVKRRYNKSFNSDYAIGDLNSITTIKKIIKEIKKIKYGENS